MFKKVLIPLDGSVLAECTLPVVKEMAAGGQVQEVVLLRVIETDQVYIPHAFAKSFDFEGLAKAYREEAKQYLDNIQKDFTALGIKVKAEMVNGQAAPLIASYANEKGVDLIVIATHGHTGISEVVFGSVALKVLHDAEVPVLLIRAGACQMQDSESR